MKFILLLAFAIFTVASANVVENRTDPVFYILTSHHNYPHMHFTETVFSIPEIGLYLQLFERVDVDALF